MFHGHGTEPLHKTYPCMKYIDRIILYMHLSLNIIDIYHSSSLFICTCTSGGFLYFRATPSFHPFIDGFFHKINHGTAIGVPPTGHTWSTPRLARWITSWRPSSDVAERGPFFFEAIFIHRKNHQINILCLFFKVYMHVCIWCVYIYIC